MKILFNINETVKVKLIKKGKEIHFTHFYKYMPPSYAYVPPVCNNEWSEFSLHELMNIYSEYMYMGNIDLPFETEIVLAD